MKFYLGGSIAEGQIFSKGVLAICNLLEEEGHEVLSKNFVVHPSSEDKKAATKEQREAIVSRDTDLIGVSDGVILEVSQASHGEGYEHRVTEDFNKPLLLLRHKSLEGKRYSAFLDGTGYEKLRFAFYDKDTLKPILKEFIYEFFGEDREGKIKGERG
jgi:hypothetical protein